MTVRVNDVVLAASWTHNFSSWSTFVNWLNNSNFAGLLLGIVVPGIFTYAFVYWQHHKTRAHISAHHRAVHEHLQRIEDRLLGPDADTALPTPPAASQPGSPSG